MTDCDKYVVEPDEIRAGKPTRWTEHEIVIERTREDENCIEEWRRDNELDDHHRDEQLSRIDWCQRDNFTEFYDYGSSY